MSAHGFGQVWLPASDFARCCVPGTELVLPSDVALFRAAPLPTNLCQSPCSPR